MTVYAAVFLAISLCVLVSYGNVALKTKNYLYWGCATALIVLSAVRDFTVGADTLNYCQGYQYIQQLSFENAMKFGWEQGYVAINWLLGQFFDDERTLLVFMATFILMPIFIWIKRESKSPLLSLIVFVGMGMWNSSMFILRQWCAMAILTFSYKYIKERRFAPFIFLVLVAMMFHRTAAIFILAYFIEGVSINKTSVFFSIPLSIAIGLLGDKILGILNRFARISEGGNFNGGVSMLIVLWLCIIATFVCFKGLVPEKLEFYFKLVFLAAFLQPIAFTFSNWARIVAYFSISLTVFLPNLMGNLTGINTRNRKLRIPVEIVLMLMMFIWFKATKAQPYRFMGA